MNYNIIKKEIEDILPNSPLEFELAHSRLTLKWLIKLKPDADEALRIAAISHDIDRAITGITEKDLKDFSKLDEFKKEHSIRSANIISDLLKKHNYSKKIIEKVKRLVECHEFGGEKESDVLKEADSLAYFDYNIPFYLKRNGIEKTKKKIKFMYDRLSGQSKKFVNDIKFNDKEVNNLVKSVINN